jgi:hypothetical protein
VAGFLIQYINLLQLTNKTDDSKQIHLILGGYSYGSLITSRLPEISEILAPFSSQAPSTTAREITAAAHDLSSQSNRPSRPVELSIQNTRDAEVSRVPQEGSSSQAPTDVPQSDQDGQRRASETGKS